MVTGRTYLWKDKVLTVTDIARMENVNGTSLRYRLLRGESVEEALEGIRHRRGIHGTEVPYNGDMCTLTHVARSEGVAYRLLRKVYLETGDISEAIRVAQGRMHMPTNCISYRGAFYTYGAFAEYLGCEVWVVQNAVRRNLEEGITTLRLTSNVTGETVDADIVFV